MKCMSKVKSKYTIDSFYVNLFLNVFIMQKIVKKTTTLKMCTQ